MTISASTAAQCRTDAAAPTPMPGHDALLAMTVPLMGHRWQRDRIVLSTNSQERVRAGMTVITLAHSSTPSLAFAGPQRIALAYDPAALADARAALIAASAQGGCP